MIANSLHGNNKLIRKSILRMLPSSFAAVLTVSIALMVDTLLAGSILGQQAIAAVAIGTPAIGIFQALTQTITSGAIVKITVHAGRGNKEGIKQAFTMGVTSAALLGIAFIAVCLLLTGNLVQIFGGAGNPTVAAQAAVYLQASSLCILMGSFNMFLGKILTLYGYQKAVFVSALIACIGNVVFSILYINLLPAEIAIAGLGMGTWTGGFLACLFSTIVIVIKKVPVRFRLKSFRLKELPEILRLGIPTSGNNLAEGLVSGVINNIIVMGFGGDTTVLSIYVAVKGVFGFGTAAVMGVVNSCASLFGILYGARDKSGIQRAVGESLKIGLISSVIWCGLLIALLPLLARFYGIADYALFQWGVIFCMCFMPLILVMRTFIQLFESTEKTGMGLLFSIVPDSVIYPVMLALLLPVMGSNAIWLSFGANAIPFLILVYLARSLKHKSLRTSRERLLCLDETIRDRVPMLDISILANNTDVTGISHRVHEFLTEQKASQRTAYMTALCLEELAADFVAHTQQVDAKAAEKAVMDIKLFSDEDTLQIVIRNAANRYNPLDFQLDENTFAKVGVKLAQRVSRRVEYTYVFKINIVTIILDK